MIRFYSCFLTLAKDILQSKNCETQVVALAHENTMPDATVEAAITAALSLNWQKALEINNKLLSECPDDVDCLNRVGKALLELGENKKAAQFFRKVLKISKYNQIALKNLARTAQPASTRLKSNHKPDTTGNPFQMISFLEEPGKTKMINLVNITSPKILLPLNNADQVKLVSKRHTIIVCDSDNNYLGALPDDLGHRLLILMKGGNKYASYVKSISKNQLMIFVKETLRAKRFHNTPSFPATGADYLSFVREDSFLEEPKGQHASGTDEETEGDEAIYHKAEHLHQDEEPEEN